MKHPEFVPESASCIEEYTDSDERVDFISGAIVDLVEKFGTVDEHVNGDGSVLIDEGFVFKAASIMHPPQHSRQFTPDDVREYARVAPTPDVILFVRASPKTCVERMRERASGPPNSWQHLDSDEHVEFATESTTVAKTIADAFEAEGAEIVEIDTDDLRPGQSISNAAQRISELK